jgi:hypothetical protein
MSGLAAAVSKRLNCGAVAAGRLMMQQQTSKSYGLATND